MKFLDWLKDLAKKEGVQIDDLPGSPPAFSEADVQTKIDAAVAKAKADADTAIATVKAEFAEAQTKKEADLVAREEKLKNAERETRSANLKAFCEGLLKEGKLTPAVMKFGMGMESFLEQIASIETTVEFGEGDDKKKQTPLEFMQGLLSGLGKQIEFKEVATDGNQVPRAGSGNAGEKIETLIAEKMKADPKLSYSAAFAEVQTENKELADEYVSEIRKED